MNEQGTATSGGIEGFGSLMGNEHVQGLFQILQENCKDTAGLTALINHVSGMEDFVKQAENKIAEMKSQLDSMKEIQNHPIKTTLQKAIAALEAKVTEIKQNIGELKTNIVEGCKNAVAAMKEKGATALDKMASFFKIKRGLQAIRDSTVKSAENCDKSVNKIQLFSKEYHETGRHLKNMVRVMVGKKPVDAVKESGKLTNVVSAPYKAEKACLLGIRKQVEKMINSLDKLERNTEANRNEQAATKAKKPTLMERLDAKKKEIKEREIEAPKKERVKMKGAEI